MATISTSSSTPAPSTSTPSQSTTATETSTSTTPESTSTETSTTPTSTSTSTESTSTTSTTPTSATSESSSSVSSTSESSSTSLTPTSTSSASSSSITLPPTSAGVSTSSQAVSFSLSQSTSGTEVITVTVRQSTTPSATGATNQDNATTSKGFFSNKGAVAGVFTVVGLIALVLLFAIITNAIRRRKAKQFDMEVAEAAAEASATAHVPHFDDLDDDHYGYRDPQAQSVYTGYSGDSHGTYAQQPMAVPESYNMSEMRSFDPYTNAGVGSGAAGVGAAGVNRSKSVTAPYNAFAGPQGGDPYGPAPSQTMYDAQPLTPGQSLRYRQRNPSAGNELDLLEAAGMGGGAAALAGAAGLAHSSSQPASSTTTSPSPPPADLARNKSLGAQTLGSSSGSGENEHFAGANYQQPFQTQPQQYQYLSTSSRPISAVDPYDGIEASSPVAMPNPHSPSAQPHPSDPRPMSGNYSSPDESEHDDGNGGYNDGRDSRDSLRGGEDYEYGNDRRVLKVANE